MYYLVLNGIDKWVFERNTPLEKSGGLSIACSLSLCVGILVISHAMTTTNGRIWYFWRRLVTNCSPAYIYDPWLPILLFPIPSPQQAVAEGSDRTRITLYRPLPNEQSSTKAHQQTTPPLSKMSESWQSSLCGCGCGSCLLGTFLPCLSMSLHQCRRTIFTPT